MKKLINFLAISLVTSFCFEQPVSAISWFGSKDKAEKDSKEKQKDNKVTEERKAENKETNKKEANKPELENEPARNSENDGSSQRRAEPATSNTPETPADTPVASENNGSSQRRAEPAASNTPETPADTPVDKDSAVVFKDGSKIGKEAISGELSNIPLEVSSKISYAELQKILALKLAYQKIINDKAKELKLSEDENVKKSIETRKKAYVVSSYLNEAVQKTMTDSELEKYYNEMWDKHMKGTNEISGIMISAQNKMQADRILKVKSADELNKVVKELNKGKDQVATQDFDMPEMGLPPDIVKQIKAKGNNSIVGPFEMQGVVMLLFVKSVHPAVKKPFTEEVKTQYKMFAQREFTNRYVNNLIKSKKVVIYDLSGKPIDLNSLENQKAKKDDSKTPVNLSGIKDDFVIAKIGDKQTLKVSDLYEAYNIKSLENELFASMSVQLQVSMEEVITSAIKLLVQDKLIEQEVESSGFMNSKKMVEKYQKIEEQQLRRAYFNKTVKITESDARKEFNKYLEKIKPEDKDDQEVSARLILFDTEKKAQDALAGYKKNPKQFATDFEKASKEKNAFDLGYMRKPPAMTPISPIWEAIKKSAPAACCQKIIKLDGATFGMPGKNFAVAYVGDRRQIKLPTFQETQTFFRKVAEKMQAIAIAGKLMKDEIMSVNGVSMSTIKDEELNKMLISIVTEDTELLIERTSEK